MLIFGKLVQHVPHFVVTAALYRLFRPKTSWIAARNALARSITNRYLLSVGSTCSRRLVSSSFRSGVLGRATTDAQNVLCAMAIDAHGADYVVIHRNAGHQYRSQEVDLVRMALTQLGQLLDASLDRLPA